LQNALNSLLDFTIQESELHKNFAEEIKVKVLQPLHEIRIKLSKEKENWLYAINALKTNLVATQEKLKQEQQRLKAINQDIDKIKERKKKAMEAIGLDPMEEITFNNLPEDIKKLEKAILDRTRAKKEMADSCEASNNSASQTEEHYKARLKRILYIVEQDESLRINITKKALIASNDIFINLKQNELKLGDIANKNYGQINSAEDIQSYIRKNSLCSTNEEELKILYKSLGEDLCADANKKLPEAKKVTEADRLIEEKIKRNLIALKQLRNKVGKQEELYGIYPLTSLLKKTMIHSELKHENSELLKFFLYAMSEFSEAMAAKIMVAKNPFRSSKERSSITLIANHSTSEFTEKLIKQFNITEAQKAYVEKLIEGIEVTKTTTLKSIGFYTFLLHLLRHWIKTLNDHLELVEEFELQVISEVYTITWAYIFWQVFNRAEYKDEEFDQECAHIVHMIQFSSYMPEASLLKSTQFAEFTLDTLEKLKERYLLKPSLPFALKFFYPLVALVDEENFGQLMRDAKLLFETLGIDIEWAFTYLLKYIADSCVNGSDYTERNEEQIKGLRRMLKVKRYIEANGMQLSEKVTNMLEITPELHESIERVGILLSVAESFNESLVSFKASFEKCVNKLKAVLELNAFLHGIM
jgi:hypothetical protein